MTKKSTFINTFFLLSISIIFGGILIFDSANATPPLPTPPTNEIASEKLLIEGKNEIIKSEYLILEAKKINLSGYTFFDKIFVKIIIGKMQRKINSAKQDLKKAEKFHSIQVYGSVSASIHSLSGKTSYANHNLEKIIKGKKKRDRNKVEIESITISSSQHVYLNHFQENTSNIFIECEKDDDCILMYLNTPCSSFSSINKNNTESEIEKYRNKENKLQRGVMFDCDVPLKINEYTAVCKKLQCDYEKR